MVLVNLAIGLLTMMGCLILQITFTLWSVRCAVRHSGEPGSGSGLFPEIRTLLMAMVIMMLGNFFPDHALGNPVLVAWGVQGVP